LTTYTVGRGKALLAGFCVILTHDDAKGHQLIVDGPKVDASRFRTINCKRFDGTG
jgi:hypothetical protein